MFKIVSFLSMHKFKYIVENSGVEKDGGILPSDSE